MPGRGTTASARATLGFSAEHNSNRVQCTSPVPPDSAATVVSNEVPKSTNIEALNKKLSETMKRDQSRGILRNGQNAPDLKGDVYEYANDYKVYVLRKITKTESVAVTRIVRCSRITLLIVM